MQKLGLVMLFTRIDGGQHVEKFKQVNCEDGGVNEPAHEALVFPRQVLLASPLVHFQKFIKPERTLCSFLS